MPYGDDVIFTLKVINDPRNRGAFQQLAQLAQPIAQQIQSQIAGAINRGVQQGVGAARQSVGSGGSAGSAARPWPGMAGLGQRPASQWGQAAGAAGGGFAGQMNASTQAINANTNALNQNTNALNRFNQQNNRVRNDLRQTRSVFDSFGSSLRNHLLAYFTVSTIADFTADVVKLGAELERTQVRFEVLTGSAGKAERIIAQMKTLSGMSGTSLGVLNRGASTMLGYGVDSGLTSSLMRPITAVTAGDNAAAQRATVAVSQIMGMGRLQKQEVNQLINAGFNPLRAVAKLLNKDLEDVRDMMKSGAISAETFAEALMMIIEKGGDYDGMLEKMAATTSGKLSKVASEWERLKTAIGQSQTGPIGMAATDISASLFGYRKTVEGAPKGYEATVRSKLEDLKMARDSIKGGGLSSFFAATMIGPNLKDLPKKIEALQKIVDAMDKADMTKNPSELAKIARGRIDAVYDDAHGKSIETRIGQKYGDKSERVSLLREQSTGDERKRLDLMISQGATLEEMLRVSSEYARVRDEGLRIELEQTRLLKEQEEARKGMFRTAQELVNLRDSTAKKLGSAAENFADLSLLDKRSAIMAQQKAQREGYASLNRDERDALSRIGTKDAQDAVRANRIAEAESFGFGDTFGKSEKEIINKTNETIARFDAETKVELRGKIELDDTGLMNDLVSKFAEFERNFQRNLDARFAQEREKNKQDQQRANLGTRNGMSF